MNKDFVKNKIKIILANKNFPDYFNEKDRRLMEDVYQENRKDKDSVPKDPTFWTTFLFQGTSAQDLHCTHKFLGKQDDGSVKKIIEILDNYFSKNPFQSFTADFGVEEFFGENNDIRVLTPNRKINEKNVLLDLRNKLSKFREDNYSEYRPHVTTEFIKKVSLPITGYALLYGNTILRLYE
jgi:hypothetical protein